MKDVGVFVKTSLVCFLVAARLHAVFTDDLPEAEDLQQAAHAAVCAGDVRQPAACLQTPVRPVRVGSLRDKTTTRKSFTIFLLSFSGTLQKTRRHEDPLKEVCQVPQAQTQLSLSLHCVQRRFGLVQMTERPGACYIMCMPVKQNVHFHHFNKLNNINLLSADVTSWVVAIATVSSLRCEIVAPQFLQRLILFLVPDNVGNAQISCRLTGGGSIQILYFSKSTNTTL